MYDVCCENAKATQRQSVDSVIFCVFVGEEICRGKITIVAMVPYHRQIMYIFTKLKWPIKFQILYLYDTYLLLGTDNC